MTTAHPKRSEKPLHYQRLAATFMSVKTFHLMVCEYCACSHAKGLLVVDGLASLIQKQILVN